MQFDTEEDCFDYLEANQKRFLKQKACNGTYDSLLCFEATSANSTLKIPCPKFSGLFDTTKTMLKVCLADGTWEGVNKTNTEAGYTDYYQCMTQTARDYSDTVANSKYFFITLHIQLGIELVGISLSILCLLFSLGIFVYHRALRCKRNEIHLNLFVAILLQSVIRLGFFFDKMLYDNSNGLGYSSMLMQKYGVKACPIGMGLLEYFQACNFMWMLCEGVYLNVLLMYSVMDKSIEKCFYVFYFIGWVLPAIIVAVWFAVMYNTYGFDQVCWFGFHEKRIYWIINGPVVFALVTNIFCLFNVIRILQKKLSTDSVKQVRQSFKAAALLLPLFGLTHLFAMYPGNLGNWFVNLLFAVFSCFLLFFNGVFLSLLYCFMNSEVKTVMKRYWQSKIYQYRFFKPIYGNRRISRKTIKRTQEIELNEIANMSQTLEFET